MAACFDGKEFVVLLPNADNDSLIARADVALYDAKSGGRDQVVVNED